MEVVVKVFNMVASFQERRKILDNINSGTAMITSKETLEKKKSIAIKTAKVESELIMLISKLPNKWSRLQENRRTTSILS
jgi:hypothetical protein